MDIPVGIKNAAFKAGLDEMKEQASGFAESVSGLFAGISLATMFEGALEKAKDVEELSKRLGETAENVQKLGTAAKLMGSNMEEVSKGGFRAYLAAQRALSGDGDARKYFDDLGISMDKLATLTGPHDTILALADAVHDAKNQHLALAAAGELVGVRQGALIEMFKLGAQAIRDMGNSAPVMGDQVTESLAKAQIQLDKFKDSLTVLSGDVLGWLMKRTDETFLRFTALFMQAGASVKGVIGMAGALAHGDLKGVRAAYDSSKEETANIDWVMRRDVDKINNPPEDKPKPPTADPEDPDNPDGTVAGAKAEAAARSAADKKASLSNEIAELEERHRHDAMSGEQVLQDLQRKRLALILESQSGQRSGNDELELKKQVLQVEDQIDGQQKKNDAARLEAARRLRNFKSGWGTSGSASMRKGRGGSRS